LWAEEIPAASAIATWKVSARNLEGKRPRRASLHASPKKMYVGSVIWDGQMKRVEINAAETEALIRMSLLEGYKLGIECSPGG